tara:strand:+ start:198 stop:1046 length:849 start_codon:yes stop_codon:yes gene_type:complete
MSITTEHIKVLESKALDIRKSIITSLAEAGSGHTAGPLDMTDILATLFFHSANIDPKNPDWPERDRIILSHGHTCPGFYAAMAHAGYFPVQELQTLRKLGSRLQGHPHREFLPALETSSGPLGSGLSQAVGMALADRIDAGRTSGRFFYCLMGDGETNEGQVWEAAMLAGKEKLGNVIGIIDRNNIQIDGYTEDVMPLEPYGAKWEAFGFHVIEIDGHNVEEIADAIDQAKAVFGKPTMIIANTIASKGVSAWERDFHWHGKPPKKEEVPQALQSLEETYKK